MKYSKADFIEDVIKEVKSLKENARKKELENLDFENLDPQSFQHCIYGQMTGNCTSLRASQLIVKSCKRFIDFTNAHEISNLNHVKANVNGRTIRGVRDAKGFQKTRPYEIQYLSTLETYIIMPWAKNKNLIAYLKGETDDLVL